MKTAWMLLAFSFAAFAPATEQGIAGKWDVQTSIAGNDGSSVCTFVEKDKVLSGSCKGDGDDAVHPLTGKVDGTKVTWSYKSDYNGTPLTIAFEGQLVADKPFKGTIEVDPMGVTGDFTAKRKP